VREPLEWQNNKNLEDRQRWQKTVVLCCGVLCCEGSGPVDNTSG
jgi:hypothetical protein